MADLARYCTAAACQVGFRHDVLPVSRKEKNLPETAPPASVRLRGILDEATERLALRAALSASHLMGLATGTHLRKLRAQNDPLAELQARLEEAELRARLAGETAEILGARFSKLPEKHRPYFTPDQRYRILEMRSLLAWSAQETARAFLVCPNTILNWEKAADPERHSVGSTVKPTPPIRRAADVVRSTIQAMTRLGLGGQDLMARILARAGWRVSARSVGRYRKEKLLPAPPPPESGGPIRVPRPVVARFVHHVWMMDISHVKQFLGPDLCMAAVYDAFSRAPLALQVFQTRPAAKDMVRLLRSTARAFGHPKYLITDQGGEFTAVAFRQAVKRLGVVPRFASKANLYATARLERFWRSVKASAGLYRLQLPLTLDDLEQRLALALLHYVCFRPHEGLGGATPAEAFLGFAPACHNAVEPPRGRLGDGPIAVPFHIEHLDPANRRFPILRPAA
jgi:transposase InsO family protein